MADKIGTEANETLTGTPDWDFLHGKGGNDTLNGGDGTDFLEGGSGDDTLNGGNGDDLFSGDDETPYGDDILNGGAGSDTAYYNVNTAGVRADLAAGKVELIVGSGGRFEVLNSIENLLMGSGDDLINGNDAANALDGGAGNDTMKGGAGNDYITGGFGDDALTGDGGADTFYFGSYDGKDTITDFQTGSDRIDFWPGNPEPQITIANGNAVIYWGAPSSSVTLLNVTTSDPDVLFV